MRLFGTLFACTLGLALFSPALAKPVTPANAKEKTTQDTSTTRIEELVKQLGAARFTEREEAQKELEAIGVPAVDILRRTIKEADPEVSRRASDIVRRLDEKILTDSVLTPKKIKLSLKDVSVVEAVNQLAKQSGYPVQIEGDRTVLANRKISLETGEVTFFEALDQLCARGGLVERGQNTLTTRPNPLPNPPIVRPQPRPLPIQKLPKAAVPPVGGIQGGVLPQIQVPQIQFPQIQLQPGGFQPQQIPLAPNGNIDVEKLKKQIDEQIKQLQQQGGGIQGGIQILPLQGNPADFEKMKKMIDENFKKLPMNGGLPGGADFDQIKKAMDAQMQAQMQMMQQLQAQIQLQVPQVQPGQPGQGGQPGQPGQAGKGQAGQGQAQPGIARPGVQIARPPIRPLPTNQLNPQQIVVADGKPVNVPTFYAGAARVRLLPPASIGMTSQPGEMLLVFEITAEPRLQVFRPQGAPNITLAKDDVGQHLMVVEQAPANPGFNPPAGAFNPAIFPANNVNQRIIPVRLKLGDKKAQTLKELKGTQAVEVSLPPEPVMVIDNVLNAKGQTVKNKNNDKESMTLEKIDKVGDRYRVEFSLETPINQPNVAVVQIQVSSTMTNTRQIPNLADAQGKNYQPVTGPLMNRSRVAGGMMKRTYTVEYRADAGQGDPARLVMSEPRFTNIAVPFEFKNVQLP